METTDDLVAAVRLQREAVNRLGSLLHQYRHQGANTDSQNAVEEFGDSYLHASAEVGGILMGALDDSPEDSDAARRLMAALTVDAKVVEQAALLSMMREPFDPEIAVRDLTTEEILDLGQELPAFAEPLLDEILGGGGPAEDGGTGSEPGPGPSDSDGPGMLGLDGLIAQRLADPQWWDADSTLTDLVLSHLGADGIGKLETRLIELIEAKHTPTGSMITPYVETILNVAAKDMVATAGAVALPLAHVLAGAVLHGVGSIARSDELLRRGLEPLHRIVMALRRLAHKAWRAVMQKLARWSTQIDAATMWLGDRAHEIVDKLSELSINSLLWRGLACDVVVIEGDGVLSAAPERLAKCPEVVKHHAKQRKLVGLLNKGLPVIITGHPPAGAATATVALAVSVWSAHDHTDSPLLRPVRIPGNPGLLQAIGAVPRRP